MSEQICRFCNENMKLAYYCEGCGASCCSDCLDEEKIDFFVCQECDSKNINIQGTDSKKVCKECGSDNIIKISQHLKSCPKCHSHKIVNIYEKKEELEQKFLELIKDTRSFIKPVREIVNKAYILRHAIKKARGPPIKCLHYPHMEEELLEIFKGLAYLKSDVLEKINVHFRHVSMNQEYFFDIYNQPHSNIRVIEGIKDNLIRSFRSIHEFINTNIEKFTESMEQMQENLQFIDKVEELFASYKHIIKLAENEKPVYAIKAKLSNGLNNQDSFGKSKGILFITNYDLSFVHEHGIFKKHQDLIFKAPVDDLEKIREKGKIFKKLYIEFNYGKYEFSIPSDIISKAIDYILLARDFNDYIMGNNEASQRLNEIMIELGDLINYIEEGINSFFSLKCQYNNKNQKRKHSKSAKRSHHKKPAYQEEQIYHTQKQTYSDFYQSNPSVQNKHQYSENHYSPHYSQPREAYHSRNYSNNYYEPTYPSQNQPYGHQYRTDPSIPQQSQGPKCFYPQNSQYPERYQNYTSDNINDLDYDERSLLMKRLEKQQKYGGQIPPQMNPNYVRVKPTYLHAKTYFDDPRNPKINPPTLESMENQHLSEIFHNDRNLHNSDSPLNNNRTTHDKDMRRKLLKLKQDRYSLKETLKKLDAKFDQGIISEVDYFRTYKNLQKSLYSTENQIKSLKNEMNNKRYFS